MRSLASGAVVITLVVLCAATASARRDRSGRLFGQRDGLSLGVDPSTFFAGGDVGAEAEQAGCLRRSTAASKAKTFSKNASHSGSSSNGGCVTCNNSETCCDGESCCSNGQFCCSNTATCCQDTCCNTPSESCCPDPVHGGVCCMAETTFCCAPQPNLDLPSRCCPRWYVCCDYGRYGCCDPDTMLPMENNIAYGLFLEPTWIGPMVFKAATIDLASGTRTEVPVVGFHTEQESTRTFMFDKHRSVFMLLQANFTATVPTGEGFPIHFFSIDPVTGLTTVTPVTGAQDEVTGYRILDGGSKMAPTILFSTWWYGDGAERHHHASATNARKKAAQGEEATSEASTTPEGVPDHAVRLVEAALAQPPSNRTLWGYKFYTYDVLSGTTTLVARHPFNKSTGHDNYAGWFHEAAPDASRVYRLGYEDVVTSANFGMSVTTFQVATKQTTTAFTLVPRPDGTHGHYRSVNILFTGHPTGSVDSAAMKASDDEPLFLSLAPTYNVTRAGDLALFSWKLSDPFNSPKKLANFSNAHTTPYFGPLSEALSMDGKRYVAVVVQDSILGSDYDTWGLGTADLTKPYGSSSTEVELQPGMLAVTVSVSGIGLPMSP